MLNKTIWNRLPRLFGGLLVLVFATACSSSPTSTVPPAAPKFSVVFATVDLAVGSNRVVFGLIDSDGMPVRSPEAQVRAVFPPPGQDAGEVRDTAMARFFQWPAGPQGVFSATLNLDAVGAWRLEVDATTADGTPVTAQGSFLVQAESDTPAVGAPAPASVTPTVDEVDDLATITSSLDPDSDLYRLSIHEALKAGKPLVVVFATPAFCVTATCGPQVEIVSELKERFSGRANFIHVEVFENPREIEGGRPAGGFVKAVSEWNLPTEPFTFIVDADGRIRSKFEGFTTAEELEAALREIISA